MRFTPNADQEAFLSVLSQMMQDPAAAWRTRPDWGRYDWAAEFDQLLDDQGFYDAAREESIGPLGAGLLVVETARLPVLVEAAASSLIRPRLPVDLPRPMAIVWGDPSRPARFLPVARSVLHLQDGRARVAVLPAPVAAVESLFAYPMGVLPAGLAWQTLEVAGLEALWRLANALEMVGAMQGGLDAVVAHVTERRQFGRPLGAFQALQHRLAEAAVKVEGGRWLSLQALAQVAAAPDDPRAAAQAALALGYVQQAAQGIVYDLHQFMGASGLTLEHPLHRWTYRLRLLGSACGGAAHHMALAAAIIWGENADVLS